MKTKLATSSQSEQPQENFDFKNFIIEKAKQSIRGFELTEPFKATLKALCFYFTNDPSFEKMNPEWKLYKGLHIWGNVGVGKTSIMRLFIKNPRINFDLKNCRQLSSSFSDDGSESITKFKTRIVDLHHGREVYGGTVYKGVCFDDLGVEVDGVAYGRRMNVLESIILDRYDNRVPFDETHITTNLDADDIEKRYGTRVRSRMREMFNLIELHGTDLRK